MTAVYLDPNKGRMLTTIVSSKQNSPEPKVEGLIPMSGPLEATEWSSQ